MASGFTYVGNRTGLITLPDRTITSSPSGLMVLKQKYACAADQIESIRELFRVNKTLPDFPEFEPPGVGGADDYDRNFYIWPEPEEQNGGNGFIYITATAYGLRKRNGKEIRNQSITTLSASGTRTVTVNVNGPFGLEAVDKTYNWSISEVWLLDVVTFLTATSAFNSAAWTPTYNYAYLTKRLIRRTISGETPPYSSSFTFQKVLDIEWSKELIAQNNTNFGLFQEREQTFGWVPISVVCRGSEEAEASNSVIQYT